MKQALLDRIRIINKFATNRALIYIAGRQSGHFAILTHTGRKSGKLYRIPVIAEPFKNGFAIALTYGRKVDWCKNVLAKGSCELRWKNKDYALVKPEFIDQGAGSTAFPALFRWGLKAMRVADYISLEIRP